MVVREVKYKLGKRLENGCISLGLYAIMSSKKDIVLRVSMTNEHAELLTQDESRYIREVYLVGE